MTVTAMLRFCISGILKEHDSHGIWKKKALSNRRAFSFVINFIAVNFLVPYATNGNKETAMSQNSARIYKNWMLDLEQEHPQLFRKQVRRFKRWYNA